MFPGGIRFRSISFCLAIFITAIFAYENIYSETEWLRHTFALYPGSSFYSWLTYSFLHGNIVHLLFNLLVLMQAGHIAEHYLGYFRFVLFSALCAIIAGLGTQWIYQYSNDSLVILIGYSGVLFGYIGLFIRIAAQRAGYSRKALIKIAEDNMLLIGFMIFPFFVNIGISAEAHLIGFLFGFICAPLFLKKKIRVRRV